MKRKRSIFCLFSPTVFSLFLLAASGQSPSPADTVFKNLPVRFQVNGRPLQQILAVHSSPDSGPIVFFHEGKELLKTVAKKGKNKFLLTVAATDTPRKTSLGIQRGSAAVEERPFLLQPPRRWEVSFVQHSHTDIGYTRPQSEILAEQMRYMDYALDYCDQTDSLPEEARFRWTCESSWVTREYLRSRPSSQIARLKRRIEEGRIEVTGLYCNLAEIADENILYDFLQPLRELTQKGIPVKTAMQNDVNGIAWCFPDYLQNTGVKYLVMGINRTRSLLPFDLPTCFWWEAPSGARMLAFRADHYHQGNMFGLVSETLKPEEVLEHLADLQEKNYPFDRIAIQFSGYWTDNAPPSTLACRRVQEWNARYDFPKLRLAVAGEFLEYVEKNHSSRLPVHRQAWLDWWTDGTGSASRETAEVRRTQNWKQTDEGLLAMTAMLGGELSPLLEGKLEHISENAIFYDEHTFGADESISDPISENSHKQWLQKGAYAWEALKRITLVNEEALARFQPFLKKTDTPVIYVINSMGWTRSGNVELFIDNQILPPDRKFRIFDPQEKCEIPTQRMRQRHEGAYWLLEVKDVPALGYKALRIESLDTREPAEETTAPGSNTLENRYYRLTLDPATGAISSLIDKEWNRELVDSGSPWMLGQLIHETLPDRRKMTPSHTSVIRVKIEKGTRGPVWESMKLAVDLPGFEKGKGETPKGIEVEFRLYRESKKLECLYSARKEMITDPEALYVAFPFSLPDSRIVFETIGGILEQGQQLPGSSSDWNAAQNFVAVRGKTGQILIVGDQTPLWHFSDLNMGKFERYPKAGKTWLYSWVMNNYWFTNFRAYQEGGFRWSYQITSTSDSGNTCATRYGWNERNPFLTRTLPAGDKTTSLSAGETLSITGSPHILPVNVRPVFGKSDTVLLHLRELEGKAGEVRLDSKIQGKSIRSITEVDALGKKIGSLSGNIPLKPFAVKFLEISWQ